MSIIFVKIIFIFIFIIPLYFFVTDKKLSLFLNKKIILIGLIGLSYFIKNIFISGCLIYPVEFLCFESISWNDKLSAGDLSRIGEIINTSWSSYTGILSENEYVKNFNWFKTWISRNLIELLEFFITSLFALFITLLSFNFAEKLNFKSNKNFSSYRLTKIIIVLSIVLFFCLTIFLIKTPVIRMFHHVFILTSLIPLMLLMKNRKIKIKNNFIIFFLVLAFLFNGSKNLIRIKDNNFINNPKRQVYLEGLHGNSTQFKIDNFFYYSGWLGPSPTENSSLEEYNHKKIFFFNMIYKKN